jgi:hypothetical protein
MFSCQTLDKIYALTSSVMPPRYTGSGAILLKQKNGLNYNLCQTWKGRLVIGRIVQQFIHLSSNFHFCSCDWSFCKSQPSSVHCASRNFRFAWDQQVPVKTQGSYQQLSGSTGLYRMQHWGFNNLWTDVTR